MNRIMLLIAANFAVLLTFGLVLSVLAALGIRLGNTSSLLLFATLFGFGGSFISLYFSKWLAKRSTGAVVIEQPRNSTECWLLDTIKRQSQQANIPTPEIATFDSPDINAFATGANKENALIAVSTGLLRCMTQDEAEAVLAHEVSHIASGDMITLTLIQGVLNTFVIFFAHIVAGLINSFIKDEEDQGHGIAYFVTVFVCEIVFGLLASLVVMHFSRQREFRADAGGAYLSSKDKMIAALQRIKQNQDSQLDNTLLAFGINGKKGASQLLHSHPPLEQRIEALKAAA